MAQFALLYAFGGVNLASIMASVLLQTAESCWWQYSVNKYACWRREFAGSRLSCGGSDRDRVRFQGTALLDSAASGGNHTLRGVANGNDVILCTRHGYVYSTRSIRPTTIRLNYASIIHTMSNSQGKDTASSTESPLPTKLSSSDNNVTDEWVIWPKLDSSAEQKSQTEAAIRSILGPDVSLSNYISQLSGLVLWNAILSGEEQAAEIKKLEGVSLPPTQSYTPRRPIDLVLRSPKFRGTSSKTIMTEVLGLALCGGL